ncbi:unnamed protein product [Boreogadus saida]
MDVRIISAVFLCLLPCGCTGTTPSKLNQSEPSDSSPAGTEAPPPPTVPGLLTAEGRRGQEAPPLPPMPGLLTFNWTDQSCEGEVLLMRPGLGPSRCLQQQGLLGAFQAGLSGVCRRVQGCEGDPNWHQGKNITCPTLRVTCKVSPADPRWAELRSYKVATGILCVLLLLGLLVLLGKSFPSSLRAIHNRISQRRRSRWIGPTQSQSVSYHRGKTAVEDLTEKRSSFAALERLTVPNSREPSSNRNSDITY